MLRCLFCRSGDEVEGASLREKRENRHTIILFMLNTFCAFVSRSQVLHFWGLDSKITAFVIADNGGFHRRTFC